MSLKSCPGKIRVALVEDHQMFREQLTNLINREADLCVCGEAGDVGAGIEVLRQSQPDVAVVDISLKGASGLELLKDMRAQDINVPALMLSMHDESLYAERALRAGARGYITKHQASAKLLGAIRQVVAGEIYLEPRFMSRIVDRVLTGGAAAIDGPVQRLSDRELEVFELIGRGKTNHQISRALHIGLSTIDTYRARIKDKLALGNAALLQTQAAQWVQQRDGCAC